jgi:hypothetical protein
VLHYQKDPVWCFYDLVDFNDVGMPHYLENMNFSGDSLYVIQVINFPFVEDLDCNLLACIYMVALFDLSKGTLTEGLVDLIISDHLGTILDIMRNGHNELCISARLFSVVEFLLRLMIDCLEHGAIVVPAAMNLLGHCHLDQVIFSVENLLLLALLLVHVHVLEQEVHILLIVLAWRLLFALLHQRVL